MCPFYEYYHGNYCKICQKTIPRNVYRIFCDTTSAYAECPHYVDKMKSTSGMGCLGYPFPGFTVDDMYAFGEALLLFITMRDLRDDYIAAISGNKDDIANCYDAISQIIEPQIVAQINKLPDAHSIFDGIYTELILPCVALIEQEKFHEAYVMYKDYTTDLKEKYLAD